MSRRRLGLNAPKVLLVEGKDEQYVLPELLELAGISWPEPAPVEVVETDGVTKLLDADFLGTAYWAPQRAVLGLLVDANGDVPARWARVRTLLAAIAPGFPQDLDPNGVVHQPDGGPRLGVWLMPDNLRTGMLETLLLAIRNVDPAVWAHVKATVEEARRVGASFREAHRDKAELHTWLAWQDPPGQALGTAAKAHHFDVASPSFTPFVAWFRRLFEV